jgi:hypothetical protein
MGKQVSTTGGNKALATTNSKTQFLELLAAGKRPEMSVHLAQFKDMGVVNYRKVLAIEQSQRIPEMVKQPDGRLKVLTALTVVLKNALKNINVRVGLNEDQIVELADRIIDQSHEDNLALEDVVLFLQKLLVGDCGRVNDRMDITVFFERFEVYRQERHVEILRIREEQNSQYKILGKDDRRRPIEKDANIDGGTFLDLMQTYYGGTGDDAGE